MILASSAAYAVSVYLLYRLFTDAPIQERIAWGSLIAFSLPLGALVLQTHYAMLRLGASCPTWVYAELMNPERIRIYRFNKHRVSYEIDKYRYRTRRVLFVFRSVHADPRDPENTESWTLPMLTKYEAERFLASVDLAKRRAS